LDATIEPAVPTLQLANSVHAGAGPGGGSSHDTFRQAALSPTLKLSGMYVTNMIFSSQKKGAAHWRATPKSGSLL
jgi:hypothetical protein